MVKDILKKKISRREAISTGAKIGIAAGIAAVAAGVGGYFGGLSSAPTREVTKTVPGKERTVTQTIKETITQTIASPAQTITLTQTIAPEIPTGPIKIGVNGPFTGPAARSGADIKNATILAFEENGNKLLGRPVELIFLDDQSKPEVGVRAAEDAVAREKIQFILNGWHSSVAVALMDVAAKHKLLSFGHLGATNVVIEKFKKDPEKYKYWFKGWPTPDKQVMADIEAVKRIVSKGLWKPKNNKFAVLIEDTDWGRSWGEAFKMFAEQAGWTSVSFDIFKPEETDFAPIITKYKAQEVSLIGMTSTFEPPTASFLKQRRELDLKSLIFLDGLAWLANWYEITGDASDYILDGQQSVWAKPESKAFRDKFKQKFGWDPTPAAAGLEYDYARMFIDVVERAGTLDTERLIKLLEVAVFEKGVVMDRYKMDPSTHEVVVGEGWFIFPVVQYLKGEMNIIWPEKQVTKEFQLPPWLV
ncbi:MAG: ABC transporter substrate-binding protein [Nitrososphaerales archaeon]